jgi:hypothetical protein
MDILLHKVDYVWLNFIIYSSLTISVLILTSFASLGIALVTARQNNWLHKVGKHVYLCKNNKMYALLTAMIIMLSTSFFMNTLLYKSKMTIGSMVKHRVEYSLADYSLADYSYINSIRLEEKFSAGYVGYLDYKVLIEYIVLLQQRNEMPFIDKNYVKLSDIPNLKTAS